MFQIKVGSPDVPWVSMLHVLGLQEKKTYLQACILDSSYPRAALRMDKIAQRLPISFKAIKR